jgi:hypothetical protein
LHHGAIDRHSIRVLLLRLASAVVHPTGVVESRGDQLRRLLDQTHGSLQRDFLGWLKEHGLRLPDAAQVLVEDAVARPDFVYLLPGVSVAVFVDGPEQDDKLTGERDASAEERLFDRSWDVIRLRHDADWAAIAAEHVRYFGSGSNR